jgi:hypothetical protein
MITPTVTVFPAPQGGFDLVEAALRRSIMQAPTVALLPAPQGGADLLEAALRRSI